MSVTVAKLMVTETRLMLTSDRSIVDRVQVNSHGAGLIVTEARSEVTEARSIVYRGQVNSQEGGLLVQSPGQKSQKPGQLLTKARPIVKKLAC